MKTLNTLIALLFIVFCNNSHSKAFCALRDPVAQIHQLYPKADGFRSLVRTITDATRQQVMQRIPNQELHLDELGKHTLYIAMHQNRPIGIVHVRSEQSRWGLIEIAWAINLDLTIHDYSLQRSRSANNQFVLKQQFKDLIIGKDFTTLSKYLDENGQIGASPFKQQTQQNTELAHVVLINGLKTLLVTEIAWATELTELTISQAKLDPTQQTLTR